MVQRVDLGEVGYLDAVERMRGWARERQDGMVGDRLFLLEHPPVITYGQRTDAADLPDAALDIPTVAVDRGGFATYHGPGQLVGYLVVDVRARGPVDIVRWVENGLVDAVGKLGFAALRRDTPKGQSSLVGVWTPQLRKLASIGMRIRHGITTHGFALNVDPDLAVFHRFTACGLHDVAMTSLAEMAAAQGRETPAGAEVRDAVASAFGAG